MSGFPTTGYSYSIKLPNGRPNPSNTNNAFAAVIEPPLRLQPQQVYQPAAIFEAAPIIHGRQHVQPRPDLKLHPYVELQARIHPRPRYEPRQTLHESPHIKPGRRFKERDTYTPGRVLHPTPQPRPHPKETCCPAVTSSTIKPPPFLAPWECLPYPGSPAQNGARHTVKIESDCTDVSRTGMLLDLFL